MKVERTQDGAILIDLWPHDVCIDEQQASELISKLPAAGVPLPVKALEWATDHQQQLSQTKSTSVGWYEASGELICRDKILCPRPPLTTPATPVVMARRYYGTTDMPYVHTLGIFDTLEQAQAACQADYERRVMECLG